jgi:hypothetical protein
MRNEIQLLCLFYSDMYHVFTLVGPSKLPAVLRWFLAEPLLCPAESPPQAPVVVDIPGGAES